MRFYRDLNYEQLVELWRKEEMKRRASRPTILFHNDFTPAITSYGWLVDDGATSPANTPTGTISFVGSTNASAVNGGNPSLDLTDIAGLAEDDLVIVSYGIGTGNDPDRTMSISTSGWTNKVVDIYSDDAFEINLGVFWKVMGATPDTEAICVGDGVSQNSVVAVAMAFRGVDTTSPMDVTPTTATGINSFIANPPSIDFDAAGAWTVAIGAQGHSIGSLITDITAPSDYDDVEWISENDTADASIEIAYRPDPDDPEDPGTFAISGASDVVNYAWAAATLALRPASTIEDTSYDVDVSSGDVQLYLFVQVEEQGDDSSNNNVTARLRYDPAGGTSWQNVTASSSGIFGTADGNTAATDEAAWTTGNFKLTGEEGTAFDGLELTDDTASAPTFDFQAANYTEFVWALTADQSTLSDNQSITFNVALDGVDITLDVTPTLTVTKGGAPPSGTLSGETQALSMTASGVQEFIGAGDFQAQPAELVASAHMVPEGTADLTMQDAALDADGVQVFVGAGDLEIQAGELVAAGAQIFVGAGDFVFGSAELVASGLLQPAATGDMEAQVVALDADGAQIFVGTASFESQIAELATSGEGAEQPAGAGDFEAQLLALDAEGIMQPAGVGDLEVQDTELDAEGSATEIAGTATFERLTNP